jgi:hypothetical protein
LRPPYHAHILVHLLTKISIDFWWRQCYFFVKLSSGLYMVLFNSNRVIKFFWLKTSSGCFVFLLKFFLNYKGKVAVFVLFFELIPDISNDFHDGVMIIISMYTNVCNL